MHKVKRNIFYTPETVKFHKICKTKSLELAPVNLWTTSDDNESVFGDWILNSHKGQSMNGTNYLQQRESV